MELSTEHSRDLIILEQIEQDPDATQASLARQLNVAVGTINWHLKRLIAKGYVKVRRAQRKKLRYIITPEGMAFRARLTIDYIQNSFRLYRLVRERALAVLEQIRAAGYNQVQVSGDGEIAEVCRLTCLERGIAVTEKSGFPRLEIHGLKILVCFPDGVFWPEKPLE